MTFRQKVAILFIRAKFKILSSFSKKKAAAKAFELFCTPQSRNTRKLPPLFETADRLHFKFQEFSIAGYRWNKGGNQKVLIIHGFESSAINFEEYVKVFIKKGYEVLAFDAPAHGRSSGRQVNAIIYRDLLKFVWDEYGPFNIFLGHSFGGLVACMCLAEVEHSKDFRLVLIAPAAETKSAIDQLFALIDLDDLETRDEFEKIIVRVGGHPTGWYSISRALRNIRAKVFWVHDEDDRITPVEDAYKVRSENFEHVVFKITKGLGHRRIYRDADVVKAVEEFV